MTTYAAPIEVYRAAMPLIGAEPPTSITDQRPEVVMANAVYEGLVRSILSRHGWSFAMKRETLTPQGETGDAPAYAYAMPADVLTARYILLNRLRFQDYEIRGGKVLADVSDGLMLVYNHRAPEADWPGDFAEGIVHKLAGRMARGLLDRAPDSRDLDAQAEAMLTRAMIRDRRSHRGPEINPDPLLVRAWRGSGWGESGAYRRTTLTS